MTAIWTEEQAAHLARVEEELVLARLWQHQTAGAPPLPTAASAVIAGLRARAQPAVERALAGDLGPLLEALRPSHLAGEPPATLHALAIYEGRLRVQLVGEQARQAAVHGLAAWIALAEEQAYLGAIGAAQLRAEGEDLGIAAATALAALASVGEACAIAGCGQVRRARVEREAERARGQAIHTPPPGGEQPLPHLDPASPQPGKRVVVVGAGPAGLEAARVCAVRGHQVTVLEADSTYGGQVRIAARSKHRRDLIGIVDWRYQQAVKHGVDFRFDVLAEPEDILAENPDVVIIATGGIPDTDYGDVRAEVNDVWDVMQDSLKSKKRVIVFDDHGFYPALDAVERLATNGQEVIYVTPERTVGVDVGGMNSPEYLKTFSTYGVQTVLNERLIKTTRGEGRTVVATLRNEYSDRETELRADALVIDHGTNPNDELYFALKDASRNGGDLDRTALVAGELQPAVDGDGFLLYRIGDAVSSRNVHAALLDALRIGMGL